MNVKLNIMDNELDERSFTLTKEQMTKFNKWRKEKNLPNDYCGMVGGCFSFVFTPTSIGCIEVIKCADGTELDLTDYDNW